MLEIQNSFFAHNLVLPHVINTDQLMNLYKFLSRLESCLEINAIPFQNGLVFGEEGW